MPQEPTSEELLLARKLSRQGKDLTAIHAALGWKIAERTTQEKLARYGIKVSRVTAKRAHWGDTTTYPEREEDGKTQEAVGGG